MRLFGIVGALSHCSCKLVVVDELSMPDFLVPLGQDVSLVFSQSSVVLLDHISLQKVHLFRVREHLHIPPFLFSHFLQLTDQSGYFLARRQT